MSCTGTGLGPSQAWGALLIWLCHHSADAARQGADIPALKEAGKHFSMSVGVPAALCLLV